MKGFVKTLKSIDIDSILKGIVAAGFFGWNLLEGAVFENQYPLAMVNLYRIPIWRVFLMLLVVFSGDWCPYVAVMIAFFIFFYIMDMEVTLDKWSDVDLRRAGK